VLRNKSACLGVTPSVTGHSQEKQSRYYGNSPEMINEPGGPPRTKNTSHLAWVRDNTQVGDPGRYSGYIYGESVERTTLREFKDAVETARASVVLALRGAR
jgi:hypothetical protein